MNKNKKLIFHKADYIIIIKFLQGFYPKKKEAEAASFKLILIYLVVKLFYFPASGCKNSGSHRPDYQYVWKKFFFIQHFQQPI